MIILSKNLKNAHILVIGSGIIGKFNAAELSKLNCKVSISDPSPENNGSTSSLGILMGRIYRKRSGRAWELRQKSLELWPIWIKTLQEFNPKIQIDKPLIQLTSNAKVFEKMAKFAVNREREGIEILDKKSTIIKNIDHIFPDNKFKGIVSYEDGRINPIALLKTLDKYLDQQNIHKFKNKIIKISKLDNKWIALCKGGEEIVADAILVCNSLNTLKIIDSWEYQIKLKPVLGQAIELSFEDKLINFLSLPKVLSLNGKNFIPIEKNKIIIGSTSEEDISPREEYINELLSLFDQKPFWMKKKYISRQWYGIRSRPENQASPILKSLARGLLLCSGFYKNGILLAPACSHWVKNEIKKHL